MAHLFQHLIRRANHEPKRWEGIIIERGQLTTSLESLRLQTGISTQSLRSCIKRLKSTSEITSKSTSKYRLITICNYSNYQDKEIDANNQTNNQTNNQLTSNQQAINKQLTTNNNVNNGTMTNNDNKREKVLPFKSPSGDFDDFWNIYPKKAGKGAAYKSWRKLKPSSELQKLILTSIEKQKKSDQWIKDNGQFIPNPATWLNQERWEDELPHRETTDEQVARLTKEGKL